MANVNFDIDLLRCFLAIAETGSFTLAGERVGRTQSAVSQRMKRLEDLAGCRLFDRGGRCVSRTSDGAAILGAVKRMVDYNDDIAGMVAPQAARGRAQARPPFGPRPHEFQ